MKKHKKILLIIMGLALISASCRITNFEMEEGEFTVVAEPGSEWLHNFPLLGPLTKKNAPTFAIWLTDTDGFFLETLFVTRKIGEAGWAANDDSRPEALPLWSSMRGGQPTSSDPAPDGITGATPRQKTSLIVTPAPELRHCLIWLEINHSVDYNSTYEEDIDDKGSPYYSGGKGGSGQPALIYRAEIDLDNPESDTIELLLIGHSEPGGVGNGTVYTDLTGIGSARKILKSARVNLYEASTGGTI